MDALISGRAGLALLIDGDKMMSFKVGDTDTLVPRDPSDLNYLLGHAEDVQVLEDASQEEVARELELAHKSVCALDLALMAIDSELSMKSWSKDRQILH